MSRTPAHERRVSAERDGGGGDSAATATLVIFMGSSRRAS